MGGADKGHIIIAAALLLLFLLLVIVPVPTESRQPIQRYAIGQVGGKEEEEVVVAVGGEGSSLKTSFLCCPIDIDIDSDWLRPGTCGGRDLVTSPRDQ